jgi:hypothetical protein
MQWAIEIMIENTVNPQLPEFPWFLDGWGGGEGVGRLKLHFVAQDHIE